MPNSSFSVIISYIVYSGVLLNNKVDGRLASTLVILLPGY